MIYQNSSKRMHALVAVAKSLEERIALMQECIDFQEDEHEKLMDSGKPQSNNVYSKRAGWISNTVEYLREFREGQRSKLESIMRIIQKEGGMDYYRSWSGREPDGLPPIENYADMCEMETEVERALNDNR